MLKTLGFVSVGLASALMLVAPAHAVAAPRLHVASVDALAPLPLPCDTSADAKRDVAAAKKRAAAGHKLLLVDFGGNWCLDCRILAGVMDQPEMKPFLRSHYEVVTVDVGRFNKNMAIPQHYGFKELQAVPAVLIVDPRTDRPVNRDAVFALGDARTISPQGLADWLAKWVR